MIFLNKNVDDFYFPGQTAKQTIAELAKSSAVRVHKLANTGVVLPPLYYQGKEADKVAIDQLVRTYLKTKKKYWIRYNPGYETEGIDLFERVVPKKLWSFQVGINLTSASVDESIEDTKTVVKLVNRDTGKVVTKVDEVKLKAYGKAVHFEEIDKDQANTMDSKASELLKSLSGLSISQQIEGVNPDNTMPQLYSGDFIYVEEKNTGVMGGYHIRNITQTFMSDDLVVISADIESDPHVPEVQFEDAVKDPAKKDDGSGGLNQEYSPELTAVMNQYGLNGDTSIEDTTTTKTTTLSLEDEALLASITDPGNKAMAEYKNQRQASLNGVTAPKTQATQDLTAQQTQAIANYKAYAQSRINDKG
jgi:hypothetical protein